MASARSAVCLLALLLLLPAAHASDPVPPGSVWLVHTTVEATVADNYAIVDVIARIENRGPDPEFPFQVRVPDGAFVSGLKVERDGETFEARIADRDEARAEYEEHKASEMTGALVEKKRGAQTYAFLVNVAEFESVTATLRYEHYLAADAGTYHLDLEAPVSGFGEDQGARFDITVRHSDSVTDAWGDAGTATQEEGSWVLSHEVGPRPDDAPTPFAAHYTLPATADGGSVLATTHNGTGYFAHRFRAPDDAQDMPVDLTLVLDTSGSMSGLKITQLQDAARQVVGALDATDRLQMVPFSSGAEPAWPGLRLATEATKEDARQRIDALWAGGGTHIEDGLRQGFAAYPEEESLADLVTPRLAVLVLLTDGQATQGITDPDALRQIAQDENRGDVRVFGLAFGQGADWGLIAGLAADGSGTAMQVPEGDGAEVDLRRFMTLLTAPVLRDVEIHYDQDVAPVDAGTDVLFSGSEMVVVGTFEPGLERLSGTVTATTSTGPRVFTFDEPVTASGQHAFLPRLVAATQIHAWQQQVDADGEDPQTVDAVTDAALLFGFVTDYTSLVLTLPEGAPLVREWDGTTDAAESADGWGGASAPASPPATPAETAPGGWGRDGASGGDGGDGSTGGRDDGGELDLTEPVPGIAAGPLLALLALAAIVTMLRRR